jgi:hypothetical protein
LQRFVVRQPPEPGGDENPAAGLDHGDARTIGAGNEGRRNAADAGRVLARTGILDMSAPSKLNG